MTQQEAIKRWDDFLSKIRERANELFEPARKEGLKMFIEAGNDQIPMINAFNGIRAQMLALCLKVDDTYTEKVSDILIESGIQGAQLDVESAKRDQLRYSLETTYQLLEMEVRYLVGIYVVELAKQDLAKPIACTQCLAPLEKPPHLYRAEHLICKFCETVNTYEPGTYQRMLGSFVGDIAKWKAREELKKQQEAYSKLNGLRGGELEKAKVSHKAAQRAYAEKYLTELKVLMPETDIEKEIELEIKRNS